MHSRFPRRFPAKLRSRWLSSVGCPYLLSVKLPSNSKKMDSPASASKPGLHLPSPGWFGPGPSKGSTPNPTTSPSAAAEGRSDRRLVSVRPLNLREQDPTYAQSSCLSSLISASKEKTVH